MNQSLNLKGLKSDIQTVSFIGKALLKTALDEIREGTFLETVKAMKKAKTLAFPSDFTFASLLGDRARERGEKVFLTFEDKQFTYLEINELANRAASGLASLGAKAGEAASLFCPNCPEFLHSFYAIQKLGLTVVPINVDLKGETLKYILKNSDTKYIFIHHSLLKILDAAFGGSAPEGIKRIIITEGALPSFTPPQKTSLLDNFLAGPGPTRNPQVTPDPESASLLMYTSGTTGAPKGVVYKYGKTGVKQMRFLAHAFYREDDVLYTCLPLAHANALFLAVTTAMTIGASVVLGRKFSASRFWEEVRRSKATTFNCLGAMIPILMKQPSNSKDRVHNVRLVVSAACPASVWKEFVERFGVKLIEAYGAVDGGGFISMNLGDAPIGSVGKPLRAFKHKLVDENEKEVGPGEVGELIFYTGKGKKPVEYHRDENATDKKVRDGWLRTGDLFKKDNAGFLYFVGRNTDSMRRRGENVSAYEVETAVQKHPQVLECAAYGVASELGEQDIMISAVKVEDSNLKPKELYDFLTDKLARFALPRYINFVSELPKTETHRVKKRELENIGVTQSTWDGEKEAKKKDEGKGSERRSGKGKAS